VRLRRGGGGRSIVGHCVFHPLAYRSNDRGYRYRNRERSERTTSIYGHWSVRFFAQDTRPISSPLIDMKTGRGRGKGRADIGSRLPKRGGERFWRTIWRRKRICADIFKCKVMHDSFPLSLSLSLFCVLSAFLHPRFPSCSRGEPQSPQISRLPPPKTRSVIENIFMEEETQYSRRQLPLDQCLGYARYPVPANNKIKIRAGRSAIADKARATLRRPGQFSNYAISAASSSS